VTRYRKEIEAAAKTYGLDPRLVEALVLTESAGNTDAFRFEPNYYNRYLKPKKLYPGMNPRRVSSSYGLMQVMYDVAVERGFAKNLAPEYLFIPEFGLRWGCEQLRMLFDWANEPQFASCTEQDKLEAVLASYNGGRGGNKPTDKPLRNASYVRKVLANLNILNAPGAAA
jgi:soluble lytic murein transglycosylase-like protein